MIYCKNYYDVDTLQEWLALPECWAWDWGVLEDQGSSRQPLYAGISQWSLSRLTTACCLVDHLTSSKTLWREAKKDSGGSMSKVIWCHCKTFVSSTIGLGATSSYKPKMKKSTWGGKQRVLKEKKILGICHTNTSKYPVLLDLKFSKSKYTFIYLI